MKNYRKLKAFFKALTIEKAVTYLIMGVVFGSLAVAAVVALINIVSGHVNTNPTF